MPFSTTVLTGTELTPDNFTNPPMEMGIIPFWFWNGELNEDELTWQMREYKDKGIQGLFIHGRFGLKVPYLSKDWFERVKYVVEKAKEIGLDMWIYDEMNWPSGTAERQVLKKYPHLSQKYLEMVVLNVHGPLFTFLEASDNRYINTGNAKPIAAYACSMDDFEGEIKEIIDLTPNLSFDVVIPWEAPPGKWKLLYFLEKEADYYIDALNPESTERFLEITHDQYKTAVGKDFGTVVPGFYTDEPAMHYYHVGMDNYIIPWSSRMFKIFRERRGYDLKPFLPALYANMGEKTVQIRHDFWSTLTEQYSDTYYKRIKHWCEKNGVLFTGHLLFEDRLRLHARCEGNILKHLKHMDITGVDHLYPVIGSEDKPDEHVALKLASSAAHFYGSARLLCESMGGTYWDCTLERMKWIANWETVLGVTIFNNHGYHYSIEGERKRDWPPSQFYHHTWWKYYQHFTEYMARLGHLLSGGRHVAKILLLYPIDCIWANYTPQKKDEISALIENDFNYLTDALLRMHFDFDMIDEDILNEAKIEKGLFTIKDEEYQLLILPPLTHMKETTFDTIKKFYESGGKVIADTLIPNQFINNGHNSDSNKQVTDLFGVEPDLLLKEFKNKGDFKVTSKNSFGKIHVVQGRGISAERNREYWRQLIEDCIVPDVTINNGDIFYLHRIKDNYDIYFFVNTQQKNQGEVEITFEKIGQPELWDANTGEISAFHSWQVIDDRLSIRLDFPETESHIIIIKDNVSGPSVSETNLQIEALGQDSIKGFLNAPADQIYARLDGKIYKRNTTEPLPIIDFGDSFYFDCEEDNALLIKDWKMKVLDKNERLDEIVLPEFNDQDWLEVTKGAWEMQLLQERDETTYPESLCYRTDFEMEFLPGNTRLMIDGFSGSDYRLFINGHEIKDSGQRSKLDAEIKEVDIEQYLKLGPNTVAVQLVVERRTDGILDLLKIIGDFALSKKNGNYVIVNKPFKINVGDWTQQGFPYLSGTGIYTTEIDIKPEYLDGKLFLDVECGEDVLEVIINNEHIIVAPWHPYKLDITGMLKAGNNSIQFKVTNTLINVLEAVEHKSGLLKNPIIKHAHLYELSV